MTARLVMTGIAKSFGGVPALEAAGLTVRAGTVHALMGANGAGKSTMMNILGGVLPPDAGTITLEGRPITLADPADARRQGIAFVHQELNMLATLSVAENVLIDALPGRRGVVDRNALQARTAELLAELGCAFGPDTPVEALAMGDRQMVEVARALAVTPSVLIFDEPTSSLSLREKERLFAVIAKLKAAGTAIVYITHFLDEIFAIADEVTVMRSGKTVGSGPIADYRPADIVALMLGDIHHQDRLRGTRTAGAAPRLLVEQLVRPGAPPVDLVLRPGEIVGLWGLLGSGRTELLRAMVGLDPLASGTLRLDRGQGPAPVAPEELHAEVGFVTEDRRGEGLFLPFSVTENVSIVNLDRFLGRFNLLGRKAERGFAEAMARRLNIKLASVAQPVRTLSGGNQQKVVFARWLGTEPRIYFLDEPTRGLDVGAKTEILKLIVTLAEAGAAILLVLSELEELMRVCDRYLVMSRGGITAELPGDATKEALLEAVSQGRAEAA